MKNLFFSLAFLLIGTVGFASNAIEKNQSNLKSDFLSVGSFAKSINKIFLLDDSNVSSNTLMQISNITILQSILGDTCTITYSTTITIGVLEFTVSASGTSATCEKAGAMASAGLKREITRTLSMF